MALPHLGTKMFAATSPHDDPASPRKRCLSRSRPGQPALASSTSPATHDDSHAAPRRSVGITKRDPHLHLLVERPARDRPVPDLGIEAGEVPGVAAAQADRKSTRLNSSHVEISYAVFCLKKKKNTIQIRIHKQQTNQKTK